MASSRIRGVRVALESTFASIASTTGRPSTSGLSWATLETESVDGIVSAGDPVLAERGDARSDWYALPPEPETMWSGGSRVPRRTGSITLTVPWRGIGDGFVYAAYAALPLHMLLQSGLTSFAPSGGVTDAVAAQVSAVRWTPTAVADLDVGIGVAYDLNGRREYSFITDNPADVYASPAFSAAPTLAATIRLCETLFSRAGTAPGSSVALELTGDGWRTYLYGARLASLRYRNPPRKAVLEITLQFAHAEDDHAGGILSVDPTRSSGAVAHALGSYVVISSSGIGTTSPAGLSRGTVQADEVEFTFTNTLTPVGHSNDITGMADMEVTSSEATLRLVTTVSSTYATDLWTQTQRSVLVGLGPIGAGNGAAIYLPAATLQVDASKREMGSDRVRMELVYKNGLWNLDATDGAPTAYPAGAPGDSSVRIALSY